MVVFPAQAQRSGGGRQPILFSSPRSDEAASNTPSFLPKPPESLDLKNVVQAPVQFGFDRLAGAAPLPSVTPMLSAAETARERDLLDRRRNWTLLTPAEILGAVTPEQILGIPERDAFGQPKNLTAAERYAERQNQLLSLARTNALPISYAASAWLFSDDQGGTSNSVYGGWGSPESLADPLIGPLPNNQSFVPKRESRSWPKLFETAPALAPPPPGSSMAQSEDMERFRQLLNSGAPSTALSVSPAQGGLKTTLPQALLSAGLARSQPAQIGGSFTPLTSGVGRPAELPKLTGAWGLNYTSPPPASIWAPQPAPWLSPMPQPFTVPQRKF
jgi:hypothetical protein